MISLSNADPELQKVALSIYQKNVCDYLATYADIESITELPLKEVKQLVGVLKKLGYADVSTGFDDEGYIRGRGFWMKYEKWAELDLLEEVIDLRKRESHPTGEEKEG